MNYLTVKALAKEKGCRAADLIVLAPQNDPFYVGTDSQKEMAEWFTHWWGVFGYASDVHLRRVHYRLISQSKPVLLPNGSPYQNTDNCWAALGNASKWARYLRLVDPAAFDDRRNSKPILNVKRREAEPTVTVENDFSDFGLDFPSFPDLPGYSLNDYKGEQRYHLELWAEKSTMNEILEPICRRYQANLITGVGELSTTSIVWLMSRLKQYQRPSRIFYVSDFDPAGQSMPLAVARKIEYFLREQDNGFDVRLFPIVLTRAQCKRYKLPRTPIKETEKRKEGFEERFGEGATELDALEALHPGELRKIISAEMRRYWDDGLDDRVSVAKNQLLNDLDEIREEVIAEHQAEVDLLAAEHEALRQEFTTRIRPLKERIKSKYLAIEQELFDRADGLDQYPIPQAEEVAETTPALLESKRDYLAQLQVYKTFQGKSNGET